MERGIDDLVAHHLAWSDVEIEAKARNRASTALAARIAPSLPRSAAA